MKPFLAIRWTIVAAVTGLIVAACGGGDEAPRGQCDSITGGASQLTHTCVGCTISNPQGAADGNLGTSAVATTTTGATTATATFRATAQNGVVYPAGNMAGVFYTPGGTNCNNCGITVSTYMDGVLQESRSGTNNSSVQGGGAQWFTGFPTTLQFTSVEITDTNAVSPTGGSMHLRTFEICSNGGP